MQDWQIAVLNSENLHTRRMTRSRFLKLDRKLSQLSFYNIIYHQYRMGRLVSLRAEGGQQKMVERLPSEPTRL